MVVSLIWNICKHFCTFVPFFPSSPSRPPPHSSFSLPALVAKSSLSSTSVLTSRRSSMSNGQQTRPDTVSPVDPISGRSLLQRTQTDEKKIPQIIVRPRTSTSSSSGLSIQTPRTARFVEATSVDSPIGPTTAGRNPFADPQPTTRHLMPEPQPSDVGFGYVADNSGSKHASFAGVEVPITPASPLKSALKVPGTPGRLNPLSPTFHEEQLLEKEEEKTEQQNAKDLVCYTTWNCLWVRH